ncbi:MAG: hypothetical protein K0S79_155 [Nitrospira sp.]|jgi:hypothetical protein|nr:hypothetical protein [Nitrospira sp.]
MSLVLHSAKKAMRVVWTAAGFSLTLLLSACGRNDAPSASDVAVALEWYYHGAGIANCGPNGHQPFAVEDLRINSLEVNEPQTYSVSVDFDVRPTAEVYVPDVKDFVWTLKAKANGPMETYQEMKLTGNMEVGCNLTRFTLLAPFLKKTSPNFDAATGVISTAETRYRLRGQRYRIYRPKNPDRWDVNDRPIVSQYEVPSANTQFSIER